MTTPKKTTPRKPEIRSRRQVNIRCTETTIALMQAVQARDGVPFNAQVERAIVMWAASKGITLSGEEA